MDIKNLEYMVFMDSKMKRGQNRGKLLIEARLGSTRVFLSPAVRTSSVDSFTTTSNNSQAANSDHQRIETFHETVLDHTNFTGTASAATSNQLTSQRSYKVSAQCPSSKFKSNQPNQNYSSKAPFPRIE